MNIDGFYFMSCPVCGSDDLIIVQDFDATSIVCRSCGTTSGWCSTLQECEDIWIGKNAKVLLPIYDGS